MQNSQSINESTKAAQHANNRCSPDPQDNSVDQLLKKENCVFVYELPVYDGGMSQ